MISCLFDLTKLESYKSIRVLLVWIVDTLSLRERLCTLAAGLSSQGTVTVDAIVEAAATPSRLLGLATIHFFLANYNQSFYF